MSKSREPVEAAATAQPEPLVIDLNPGEAKTDLDKFYQEFSPLTARFFYQLEHQAEPDRMQWIPQLFMGFAEYARPGEHGHKFKGVLFPYTVATRRAMCGVKSLTYKNQLSELEELQSAHDKLVAEQNKRSPQATDAKYNEQVNQVAAGQDITPRSLDEIRHQRIIEQRAIAKQMAPITQRAAELTMEIVRSTIDRIKWFMLDSEAAARSEATELDIIFSPPAAWMASGHILIDLYHYRLERLILLGSPRKMLEGLLDL